MGAAAYLQALQLNDEALYDAQGNHCDRAVVSQRLAGAIRVWLAGCELAKPKYPTLRELERNY
eukprot:10258595-Lingulodinium_polyedra.AAC.1